MHITKTIGTVFCLTTVATAVPTPWSESILEDINNLRASGLSESEIALRFPRALFYPNPTDHRHKITVYSHPDLRSHAPISTDPKKPATLLSTIIHKISSPFSVGGSHSWSCEDDDNDTGAVGSIGGIGGGTVAELLKEEDRRMGRGRFKEGVGRRGEQMGRKKDSN